MGDGVDGAVVVECGDGDAGCHGFLLEQVFDALRLHDLGVLGALAFFVNP